MGNIEISELSEITDEVVSAFARLMPQLASSLPPPTKEELIKIIASADATVLIAVDSADHNTIVGTSTLVVYRTPVGLHAWIEDVVVDLPARGKGVGEALTLAALRRAQASGADCVNLTSHPLRDAANRLYVRLNFERSDTNFYQYHFETQSVSSTPN